MDPVDVVVVVGVVKLGRGVVVADEVLWDEKITLDCVPDDRVIESDESEVVSDIMRDVLPVCECDPPDDIPEVDETGISDVEELLV